jgi:hypothetical protein
MLTLLIILFVVLIVVGVGAYYAPMDPKMKNIIYAATGVVTFVVLLVFVLNAFGLLHGGLGGSLPPSLR